MIHYHYFLQCPNAHYIPVPHPNPLETDGSPRNIAKDNRKAVFVCPDCGLVNAYSVKDMVEHQETQKQSLFQTDVCHLVSLEIECDGQNCAARKVIHAVQDTGKGMWKEKVVPKDWKFSDSARCEAGHMMRFDESRGIHWAGPVDLPF